MKNNSGQVKSRKGNIPGGIEKVFGSNDPFDTVVKEGAVEVSFSRADRGRVKLHITVDFSKHDKMNDDPHVAAIAMGKVIAVLRKTFKVKLEEIKV